MAYEAESLTVAYRDYAVNGQMIMIADDGFGMRISTGVQALRILALANIFKPTMKKNVWRAVIEVSFIIFLFYSNRLMGEFERSGMGEKSGLTWAMADVFTSFNFGIALIAALVGYVLFEFLRKRF